jgi:hypothetical protein
VLHLYSHHMAMIFFEVDVSKGLGG